MSKPAPPETFSAGTATKLVTWGLVIEALIAVLLTVLRVGALMMTLNGKSRIIIILLSLVAGCAEKPVAQPDDTAAGQVIQLDIDSDVAVVSTCGQYLVAVGSNTFCSWGWSDLRPISQGVRFGLEWEPQWSSRTEPYPPNYVYRPVGEGLLVCVDHEKDDTLLITMNLQGGDVLHKLSLGRQWGCRNMRNSCNGRYLAIYTEEDFRLRPPDTKRRRIGLMRPGADSPQWIAEIQGKRLGLPAINNIAVSEDGEYIATVGTCDAGFIHLASVSQQAMLWEKVPTGAEVPIGQWTVNFNDVCFSPDSTRIYVAGNCGLFCFDTESGKILSQWEVPSRCVSVAISPDGRSVAGGLIANGHVYVWDAETGKLRRDIQTGQFTVYGLAYSADGSRLASSGVRHTGVKVWKL